jgi:hypothetical protein
MTENTGHTGTAVNLRLDTVEAQYSNLVGQMKATTTTSGLFGLLVPTAEVANNVPALVAEVRRLRDENDHLHRQLNAESDYQALQRDQIDTDRAAATAVLDLIARYDAAVDGLIPGVTKNLLEGVLGHLRPLAGTRSDTDVAADYGIDLDGAT